MLDLGVTHIINCAEQVHIRKWTMLMLMLMLMLMRMLIMITIVTYIEVGNVAMGYVVICIV